MDFLLRHFAYGLVLLVALCSRAASGFEVISIDWNHVVESRIHAGDATVRCRTSGTSNRRDPFAVKSPSVPQSGLDAVCGQKVESTGTLTNIDFATGVRVRTRSGADTSPGTVGVGVDSSAEIRSITQPAMRGVEVSVGLGHSFGEEGGHEVFPVSGFVSANDIFVFDTDTDTALDVSLRNVTLAVSTRTTNDRWQPFPNDAISGVVSVFDHDTNELLHSIDVELAEVGSNARSMFTAIPFNDRVGHQIRVEVASEGEILMVIPQDSLSTSAGIRFRVSVVLPEPSSSPLGLFPLALCVVRRRRRLK